MAEAIIISALETIIKGAIKDHTNPRRNAFSSPQSSQTKNHRYRRTRGRIVPSSSNQEVAAPPSPTPPSNDPSIGDTTNATLAPTNPTPSGEGSNIQEVAAVLPSSVPPRNNLSTGVGDTTNAILTSATPSGEGGSGTGYAFMGKELFEVSRAGSVLHMMNLVERDGTGILFTVTPHGNSPLHLAVMLGHEEFAKELCIAAPALLSIQNKHKETPLIAALMAHDDLLASWLIQDAPQHHRINNTGDLEGGNPIKEMLLKSDRRQENALHHALRNGFEDIAVKILEIEPCLSEQVNKNGESPMHMACRRGFSQAVGKMLGHQLSSHAGPNGQSALHAAIEAGQRGIVELILRKCPGQASHINGYGNTPLCTAIEMKNLQMVEIFLKHDHNLAYIANEADGYTPFLLAVNLGYLDIAEKIVNHCPDSAYAITKLDEMNALHDAVQWEEHEVVDYILENPWLHRLINQGDSSGDLPLHYAAHTCNAKLLRSLVSKTTIQDATAVNANNVNAADVVYSKTDLFETPKWKEAFEFVSTAIPSGVSQLVKEEAQVVTQEVEKIKSLTEMYTGNTSVVAALLATVTFAAAFTLPGGYSTDPQDAGLPIFARNAAFQVFLFADTIAMCSSLAVAFFCGLLTWKDYRSTKESKNFLLNYREWAKILMWCAYGSTSIAFATGLYTVLAPKCSWLAIFILTVCSALPFISNILCEWQDFRSIWSGSGSGSVPAAIKNYGSMLDVKWSQPTIV